MNNVKFILTGFVCLFLSLNLYTQTLPLPDYFLGDSTECAQDWMRALQLEAGDQQSLQNRERSETIERETYQRMLNKQNENEELKQMEDVLTIPVVVHVVHREGTPLGEYENYTDSLIMDYLEAVNVYFRHENNFYNQNPYAGRNINIELCLAKRDPQGFPTSGIIRHPDDVLTFDVVDIWSGPVVPAYQWDPHKYLNIFIVSSITGFGAYANLAAAHGQAYDGIVISYQMTSDTWAHELGHYLNLYHVFNGSWDPSTCPSNNNCLQQGDLVCDTPPPAYHRLQCEDYGFNSCTGELSDNSQNNPFRSPSYGGLGDMPDPLHNYMSYDFCRKTFTQGQKDRMRDALLNIRSSLLQSNACTPIDNQRDAAICQIVTPNGLMCQDIYTPEIEIRNYGTDPLTSATILMFFDGYYEGSIPWTGYLENGESDFIELNAFAATQGSHNLQVKIQNPNGYSDEFPANDTLSRSFIRINPQLINAGDNCQWVIGNNQNVTSSGVDKPSCGNYKGNDVWFKAIVPSSGHIVVKGLALDFPDGAMAIYEGDCEELSMIACSDAGGPGSMPQAEAIGLIPGSTVYIRFWEEGNDEFGNFNICAYDGGGDVTDLSITKLDLNTNVTSPYGGLLVNAALTNYGAGINDYLTVGFYISDDPYLSDDDALLEQYWTYGLFSNETEEFYNGLYLPGYLTDGVWYIIAKADFTEEISEGNENNNIMASPITVDTSEELIADLYTENMAFFPPIVEPGNTFTISCDYTNGGNGACGTSYLRYYFSQDTIWDWTDIYVGGRSQLGLYPGESAQIVSTYTAPYELTDGQWYMILVTDENWNVYESDETNNIAYTPLTVENNLYTSSINIQVFLEGFYDRSTGKMHKKLVQEELMPRTQPYSLPPYNYDGTENHYIFPDGMVDWILVEAWTGDPNSSTPMQVVERRVGMLMEDGWIRDIDGMSSLRFYDIDPYVNRQYYYVVRHRTHLDIMTSQPLNTPTGHYYQFTKGSHKSFGNAQQKQLDTYNSGMYSGDYDGNGIINNIDFNLWMADNASILEYLNWDGDGNGIINNIDFNIWTNNKSKIGHELIWY